MSQFSQPPIFPTPDAPVLIPPPPVPVTPLRQRNLRTTAIALVSVLILIIAYSNFPGVIANAARSSFPKVKAVITGVSNNQTVHDGDTVTLSAASSSGKSLTYNWDLGDGAAAHTAIVTHTYHYTQNNGQITVSLTISDPLKSSVSGHEDTADVSFNVFPQAPSGLSFTYSTQYNSYGFGYGYYQVTFTPSFTSPDANNCNISWDMGDGSSEYSYGTNTLTNSYSSSGSYTVKMTVTDSFKQSATYTQTIQVSAPTS